MLDRRILTATANSPTAYCHFRLIPAVRRSGRRILCWRGRLRRSGGRRVRLVVAVGRFGTALSKSCRTRERWSGCRRDAQTAASAETRVLRQRRRASRTRKIRGLSPGLTRTKLRLPHRPQNRTPSAKREPQLVQATMPGIRLESAAPLQLALATAKAGSTGTVIGLNWAWMTCSPPPCADLDHTFVVTLAGTCETRRMCWPAGHPSVPRGPKLPTLAFRSSST